LLPGEAVKKHFTRDTDAGVRDRRRPFGGGEPKAEAAAPAAPGEPGSRRLAKVEPRLPNADFPWAKARAAAEVSIPLGVKVTTISRVPCVESGRLSALGMPDTHCASDTSQWPSGSFNPT